MRSRLAGPLLPSYSLLEASIEVVGPGRRVCGEAEASCRGVGAEVLARSSGWGWLLYFSDVAAKTQGLNYTRQTLNLKYALICYPFLKNSNSVLLWICFIRAVKWEYSETKTYPEMLPPECQIYRDFKTCHCH